MEMATMAQPHQQIGTYKCWNPLCGKEVPVKKTVTGKLSAPCAWCDFPHYANEGTEHFRGLLAATTLNAAPAPASDAKPTASDAKAPAQKSRLTVWGGK